MTAPSEMPTLNSMTHPSFVNRKKDSILSKDTGLFNQGMGVLTVKQIVDEVKEGTQVKVHVKENNK